MTTTTKHRICGVTELPPGSRRIVEVDGVSIGVFNVDGEYFALRNYCPHKGAPLCQGTVGGTMLPSAPHTYVFGLEDRLLRCPWHGWQIDMATGRSPFGTTRGRVATYPVSTDDGQISIEL